jgi:hypothetical protein
MRSDCDFNTAGHGEHEIPANTSAAGRESPGSACSSPSSTAAFFLEETRFRVVKVANESFKVRLHQQARGAEASPQVVLQTPV